MSSIAEQKEQENGRRILVIDDSPEICRMLARYLERLGYSVETAHDGKCGLQLLQKSQPDLILLDIDMPVMNGLEVQAEMNRLGITIPVIIITGHSSMKTAVLTIRSGAYDYLAKPLDFIRLNLLLNRCFEDIDKKKVPADSSERDHPVSKFELIGSSAPMVDIYKAIAVVSAADTRVSVLITGETGTGKELVARQIHLWSKNSRAPFVALNVTALPDTLIESELFGHEKGSFTGATQRRIGKLELAANGTLLLDEIGDISLHLQHKLLRVLQEREFYRLGGSDPIPLNARIIAATNRDLVTLISNGSFREDLFYRLNVISIAVPPLRSRREDIPMLVRHFLQKYSEANGKISPELPEATLQHLMNYPWPGNIRQLENTILRTLTAVNSQILTPSDIPLSPVNLLSEESDIETSLSMSEARRVAIEQFERKYLLSCLKSASGQVTKAAENAGLNRESFYRLMRKYDIKTREIDSPG